jgi:hypothetical protein
MLYGCGCVFVGKSNFLMTYVEIRFFWILLSTIKYSGVPFTDNYEWKRCSPPSRSSSYSSWIVAVMTIAVGFASIISILLLLS